MNFVMQAILYFLFLISAFVVNNCHPVDKKEMEEEDDEKDEVVQDTLKDDRKLVVQNPFDYENMEEPSVISEESAEKRGKMKRHKKVSSQRRCCCYHGIYHNCDHESLDKHQQNHKRGHICNNESRINKRHDCKQSRKTMLGAPPRQLS